MKIAISYDRYSSAPQEKGDSVRRQAALSASWCKRNKASLDKNRRYLDKATSAFRGENRDLGVLRQFLEEVELGNIQKGTYLLIENMDRISRQRPVPAIHLITSILMAGIHVVQLAPEEIQLTADSDLMTLFRAQMEQSRGHSESAMKSVRLLETFGEKKRRARETGEIITKRVPAWIEVRGERMVLIRERAKAIRQMFQWAIGGAGLSLIVRRLTEGKVPTWGGGSHWSKRYVQKIIRGRAVLGEHQPMLGNRPDGEPIPDYYPSVVDESTWMQAQAGLDQRRKFPGRMGSKEVSVFSGLLWDAGTQGRMYFTIGTSGSPPKLTRRRILRSAASADNAARRCTFLADVFEVEVLDRLSEIKVSEILGETEESESGTIQAERTAVYERLQLLEADLAGDDEEIPTLTRAVRTLTLRYKELTEKFNAAQQLEANPAPAVWAEAQTLAKAAKTEASRLRLRSLLRRIVESIWVLIVPKRSRRLVAVQIHFTGGERRDYLIDYRAAKTPRPMKVETLSATWGADESGPGRDFDLRKRKDAQGLEAVLARMME